MNTRLTRAHAIRAKCLDCVCGQRREIKKCPATDCPLHRYRLGREVKNNALYGSFTRGDADCEIVRADFYELKNNA